MKITIFGATGLLGKDLMRERREDELTGLGQRDADIRDAQQIQTALQKSEPEWVILAAAYTDVDGCESNQELAFSVNRDGAVNVANAAKQVGAKLLFLSSDYVFDGKNTSPYQTSDARNPQSVYGRSKAEAEVHLFERMPDCCVVRTSWLFGTGGKCFPDTILKLAASRPALDVVNDQRGSPTYSVDLARTIMQLCRKNANGIVHATNAGECTWFEFAREIVSNADLPSQVRPTSSEKMARPAPRPAYSVLSPRSLHNFGIEMPPWQDALRRYMAERNG
jgi:dTDP-4-dehydrorhamnose reductase